MNDSHKKLLGIAIKVLGKPDKEEKEEGMSGELNKGMSEEPEESEGEQDVELAQDVLDAISSRDPEALCEALHNLFMGFDSEPHSEFKE